MGIEPAARGFPTGMNTARAITLLVLVTLLIAGAAVAADTQTAVVTISGMHCEGCATGIEAMLKRTDGITKAIVSYESAEAVVEYDPAKASVEKIVGVIRNMGYKAAVKKQ